MSVACMSNCSVCSKSSVQRPDSVSQPRLSRCQRSAQAVNVTGQRSMQRAGVELEVAGLVQHSRSAPPEREYRMQESAREGLRQGGKLVSQDQWEIEQMSISQLADLTATGMIGYNGKTT